MTAAEPREWPARPAIELVLIVLLLGLFLWIVRGVLQPLVLFPLVFFMLWPARASAGARRALIAVTVVFTLWFIATVGSVLIPFLLAFAIAYLLAPAVDALCRRGIPRALAVAMVLLPFLALIVGLGVILIPELQRQLFDLVGRIPELGRRVATWILQLREKIITSGGGGLFSDEQVARLQNLQASDLVNLVSSRWNEISSRLWTLMLGIGRGVGTGLGLVLTLIGYFVVAPIVSAYLLAAWPRFTAYTGELVPPAYRGPVFEFLGEYDVMLGKFVRGQLIEATLVAVMTTFGLWILGFPAAILMGVIAGLGNLIPQVGLFLSIIPGLFIALVAPDIGPALLKLIAVFGIVQIIDGQITGPRIVGGAVGLSPVWSMVAVLVFGSLFGFLGMFLAVPLAALVRMVVLRLLAYYKASPVYS
jgi:predicted PurR-regulated permease PerM